MSAGVKGHTVTSVAQVRPDDVFLWEAEDAEPAASHRGVSHNAGVRHHVHPLKQPHPEITGTKGHAGSQTKRSHASVEICALKYLYDFMWELWVIIVHNSNMKLFVQRHNPY